MPAQLVVRFMGFDKLREVGGRTTSFSMLGELQAIPLVAQSVVWAPHPKLRTACAVRTAGSHAGRGRASDARLGSADLWTHGSASPVSGRTARLCRSLDARLGSADLDARLGSADLDARLGFADLFRQDRSSVNAWFRRILDSRDVPSPSWVLP